MKGIIFNLVEEAVTGRHGDAAWDSVVTAAGVDGAHTSLGNYPSAELVALIGAGASTLGQRPCELTHSVGADAMRGMAERYPSYFEPFASTRPFLLTLNDVIHAEVRKVHADADPPDFWFDEHDDDVLVVHYRSERRMCGLAQGMIVGAASHFGERALVTQTSCMLDGADHCVFDVAFVAA